MRIGGLCFGYGGLDLAVAEVLGAELAWYSEIDPGACKIAAHRFPGVPNVGDMTKADWSAVEPVDVVTGGTPCQDLSHAGKRGGMSEGTRSNLWVAMREAVAAIRPALVVWENVQGALSASADSEMESREGRVGVRPDGPVLRALGRVLGDLAGLGYDAGWHGLRAADVGAPHGRWRVFVVAHARRLRGGPGRQPAPGEAPSGRPLALSGERRGMGTLLPTPRATDGTKGGPNQRGTSGDLMLPSAVTLLPTPAVNDMGASYTPAEWDEWTARMQAEHDNGNGHGKSLSIETQRLASPAPEASRRFFDTLRSMHLDDYQQTVVNQAQWRAYAAAIARWEAVLGRPAPPPTQPSRKGTPQLSARFSEWLMGLPDGWVTDVPGITRNEALRALGNGVVPQQATAALRYLLAHLAAAEAPVPP